MLTSSLCGTCGRDLHWQFRAAKRKYQNGNTANRASERPDRLDWRPTWQRVRGMARRINKWKDAPDSLFRLSAQPAQPSWPVSQVRATPTWPKRSGLWPKLPQICGPRAIGHRPRAGPQMHFINNQRTTRTAEQATTTITHTFTAI